MNGVIPVERIPEVERMVMQDLVPWVQSIHESKESGAQQAKVSEAKAVTAARVEATRAKKQLARATAPGTGGVPPLRPEVKPQTFKSAEDAVNNFNPLLPVGATGST